jgi:hypothetical protein
MTDSCVHMCHRLFRLSVRLVAICATGVIVAAQPPRAIPPAFGPHTNLTTRDFAGVPSFTARDRIVGTYYFYWYDAPTGGHVRNPDGSDALTEHPPTLAGFSYRNVAWHKKELGDMADAGIDVALPVFWGAPSEQGTHANFHWSYAGLPPLVEAREQLLREGRRPPRLGLFYDTSTLENNTWREHIDLTTDYGKRWFYATIRDFFSCVPPRHWALMEGRPIVLLYAAVFAKAHDQGFVDFARSQFRQEFGCGLWLAPQDSWQVKADAVCGWGGALGLRNPGIGELGPGYDHAAVPGRAPLVVGREGGRFYERQWTRFLRRPSNFVMLETWNEFHEGTPLCDSREYGRQYIELTRRFTDLFRHGEVPAWPRGPFTGAAAVSFTCGLTNAGAGLVLEANDDGQTLMAEMGGRPALGLKPGRSRYLYFAVDDSFKAGASTNLALEVEFFDDATGSFGVEYDGNDPRAPFAGAYSSSPEVVKLTGGKHWQTATFALPGARLNNSQNAGADLRVVVHTPGLWLSRVVLRRR